MSGELRQDSRAVYEAHEGINYSILKLYGRSPAHAQEEMLHPRMPGKAMETGEALHVAVLEPGRFEAEYVQPIKVDRRTKEGKVLWAAFELEHGGKTILKPDEWAAVQGMAGAVRSHPVVAPLLAEQGLNEASVYWTDQETGAACKARPDRVCSAVLDLKQTRDARPALFAAQAARLGYHVQASFYLAGLDACAPHPRRWLWVAVEPVPPFAVAIYEPTEQTLAQGRQEWETYLRQHLECQRAGIWPGYQADPQALNLPKWALAMPELELL